MHIVPFGPPAKLVRPQAPGTEPVLPYWGGPVIANIHVVEIFWGSFVDMGSTNGLQQFFTDVTNSTYYDLLSEYSTLNRTGQGGAPSSNQLIGRGVFDGKYVITPSLCPGSAANPPATCSLTDAQIQEELVNQLPNLPAPVTDNKGNYNTVYLIYFPPGVHITVGNSQSCMGGGFCAYHSSLVSPLEPKLPYGVFPDFGPTSGCSTGGCGQSSAFDNLTSATSHEIAEAVTDVDVGGATSYAPPLAWISDTTGEEVGDLCNQQQAQITVGANTYTIQQLWSNMQNACTTAPARYEMAAPTNAVPGKAFNLTVSVLPPGPSNALLNLYSDSVHFTSSDVHAVLPADYTFVPATDAGTHTFSITLNSLGSQTITATDTQTPAINASATASVNHNADLTIVKTHTGSFTQGQTGVSYRIIAGNGGDLPTTGLVTVADTVPPDLTATSISGTGWACTLSTASCTRSDVLAAGANYPAITLTANVSDVAPASIFNNATVSGGGEVNTFNDTASDPTTVVQLPDPAIAVTHSGSFAQGQMAAVYTLTVTNVGGGTTTGRVTVTDTLPSGLTATAIAGAGWSCTLPTLTCTRTDTQPPGAVYPPINLSVNVAANAASPVTNTATVSGGGEVNTANDTASDVTVITQPASDLIIAISHNGSFTQGQSGATFTLTVMNIGPSPTSGMVTVTDSLAVYLSATDMSGTGWACTLATLRCSRSDVLAAGPVSSYPPITLTVTVSSVSPPSLSNSAGVSGGGELDTTNDSASDTVTINPWPDLSILKSHNGNFAQGQTGVTYNLTVVNNGAAPTVGTVTATDLLPAGLTATAISGSGWNCTLGTLSCTRNDPLTFFYPAITVTANVANNAPTSVTNTATVSGGGEIDTTDNTASDPTTILPPVSISLIQGSSTVKAGNPATFTLSVMSVPAGTVTLTCGTLPAETACTFSPPTLASSATVTLTITTKAPTLSSVSPASNSGNLPLYAMTVPFLGLAVTGLRRKKGNEIKRWLASGLTSFALLLLAACGGGSTSTLPPTLQGGTPTGTYPITVTAINSSANQQGSAVVTLIVQ